MAMIVISGTARSGKDTFGDYLKKNFKENYFTMAYADDLKRRCMKDFGLLREQVYGDLKEVPDIRYKKNDGGFWTPREILQYMGTDSYRAIDDNFWIKQVFKYIDRNNLKNVIITDARFVDEIEAVTKRGGVCVRLERKDTSKINGINHISETALNDFHGADFLVKNNGTLNDLENEAKVIIKEIESYGR